MSRRDKGRIPGRWFPMLYSTMESSAWRELSHGAKALYLALKKRLPGGNKAYISTRNAARELKASRFKVREWFAELKHYGFIALETGHCLGVDGVGKAPHWRLTEMGATSKANPNGVFEHPPQDFLKWDGTPFDPKPFRTKRGHTDWDEEKIKPRLPRPIHHGNRVLPTPGYASDPPSAASGSQGVSIETGDDGSHGVSITKLTTGERPGGLPVGPLKEASKPLSVKFGPDDPRVTALDASAVPKPPERDGNEFEGR